MAINKESFLAIMLCGLLLVSCGGPQEEPSSTIASNEDEIAQSVQLTLAAISVALTVEALTETQPTSAPTTEIPPTAVEEATAAEAQPTDEILPTVTNPPPTATNPPPTATSPPPTATNPPPTATTPPTPTTAGQGPPDIDNDAPGGSFPQDGTVSFDIIVDPAFLFRMDVRVRESIHVDFGPEGTGIQSVEFFIFGDEVDYQHREQTPGFCVFGGGEPTCNPWPRNHDGQYTWGVGGPVVEGGDYFVNMVVTADEEDPDFGGVWNWNFDFALTFP